MPFERNCCEDAILRQIFIVEGDRNDDEATSDEANNDEENENNENRKDEDSDTADDNEEEEEKSKKCISNVRNSDDEMKPGGERSAEDFRIGPLLRLAVATTWSRQQNTPDWVTCRTADSRARVEPAMGCAVPVSGKWTPKVREWIRE